MPKPDPSVRGLSAMIPIILIASFLGLAPAFAQPSQALTESWRVSDYNFSSRMMDTDVSANAYVLGDTVVGDYLVIKKFAPTGLLLWQQTYDPAERLRGVWLKVDGNGNAIVLASMIGGSNDTPSGWLTLKYDTNGNLLWANSLPGPFSDARRVAVDFAGNIYVAGRMWLTNASGITSMDSVLIKYAPNGTTLWTAAFDNGGAVDEPFSLAISLDGARIGVAGVSGNLFMALMYDAAGNRVWANTNTSLYPGNDIVIPSDFTNEAYVATGTYLPQDPKPYQMAIVKFDAAGNQVWLKSYNVGYRTYRLAIGDGIVATGVDSAGYLDWMTIKTDFNGSLLWSQRFDGAKINDEFPSMLAIGLDNAIYVTGRGGPNPSSGTISNLKGVVAKYSANGTPQWAVWDDFAGGRAFSLDKVDPMGAPLKLTTLGWNYLVTTRYAQTGLPDLPPAAPAGLSGQASSTGTTYRVNLNFIDNATNEFWVEAERCQGSGCTNFAKVAQTVGENATGLSDASVQQGVTYTYRARAVGFVGNSGYSNAVEVTVPPASLPPAAPGNLTAQAPNASQINLAWTNNATNQDGVKIERCRGSSCTNFAQITTVAGSAAGYTDSGLSARTAYRYRVRSYNAAGNSPYSNIASATTKR